MRTSHFVFGALALLLLSAPAAHALGVSPGHPGFDDGTIAPPAPTVQQGALRGGGPIQNLDTGSFFATIQAAHDDVTTLAGHTIEVQVGSHTEAPPITITKGITLQGQTGTETVLCGGNTTTSGDGRGWFLVIGSGLTVQNLKFDGNGFLIWQAFRITTGGDNPSFDNCTFNDIRYSASGSPYAGNALVQFNSDGMSVTDCTFSNIGRHGIFFYGGSVTTGYAGGNVYNGKGAGDWLDYGVEVGGGAAGVLLENNTITDCVGVASSDSSTSAGMLITTYYGVGTTADLIGNFLNSNSTGCFVGYDSADLAVVTAVDNDLSGNTWGMGGTSATVTTDASGNWWGSNVPATVAAQLFGDVDYTPWLDVGTDTDGGTPGFQGDFSVLNVDDDSPQAGTGGRIDEGVDLVTASTVYVADGTYVENVTVDKNVTLLSVNGRAVTTIQGVSPASELGTIFVTSNTTGVQIGALGQGFTIVGLDHGNPGVENAAVYFQGNHSNAQVLYNEIQANGDHGLLTEYGATISGFVIDNNLFTGQTFVGANPAGQGFGQQFTLPNVPRQLCVMGGGTGGGSTSNTTFTNNQVTGTAGGYNTSAQEQGNTLVTVDSNGATVTGNTFAGVSSLWASSLRCRGPATTISGNTFDSSGIEFPLKGTSHIYMVEIGISSAGVVSANTFNKVVNVDATTAYIGWSIAAFAAGVPTGVTIDVGPGTYVEQILVDGKDITLQGAGCGSSLIHSPATLDSSFTTSNVNKSILTVQNSASTTIDGFTIDGLGLGNANYRMVGVGYWNAGGAITSCCIQNIMDTPFSGSQHGVGILVANDTGGPYSLEVGDCTVTDFQKNGMVLTGSGMTLDVHDCTVTGEGYTTVIAQNGIQAGSGASGTVRDNVISELGWVGPTWAAGGLLMISGGTIDATGNHVITNVQVPVWWQDTSGSVEGVNASGQLEYGALLYNLSSPSPLREQGPPVMFSPLDVAAESAPAGLRAVMNFSMTESCLDGTTAPTPYVGMYGYSGGAALNIDATNMSINGWDYGIVADGAATTFTATANDISGNTSAGYDNTLSGTAQTATLNWWGAADGPSGDGAGSGDAVASVGGEVSFDPWLTDGTSSTSCAFTPSDNVVEPNPAIGICIAGPTPCVTVPVDIARNDNANLRGFSVDITLSAELMLCAGTSSITEGTYLSNLAGSSTVFQVLDNGSNSYTVDGALLGTPCGQTDPSGTLFEIAVKASGGDGNGTITVDSVLLRDCANAPLPAAAGAAAVIPIDTAGPVAVADLTAAQVKSGNDGDGTTEVSLSFTVPGDAVATEVWRAPYSAGTTNAYPEYDDEPGAGPPATPGYPPAAPWQLTGVTAPGTDETTERGYWYYVVFNKDDCDNWSAVSNVAGGVLNYHLGDVTPGIGDNDVDVLDLTLLGADYGKSLAFDDPVNFLDVGPTADFSVNTLPTTDNVVQFEDLMMFAINHGTVGAPGTIPVATGVVERPALVLRVSEGRELTARLVLRNHESAVKGIHSLVSFDRDALELVSVTKGGLAADAFFATLDHEAGVIVDAAVMGTRLTFSGAGEVAELVFRRKQEGAAPVLTMADLRSATNRSLGDVVVADVSGPATTTGTPTGATLELLGARPNPFRGSTDIVFVLPDSRSVNVSIYDVSGRLVRTLTDRTLPAGEHRATWDGRTVDGSIAGAGIYFYTFRAGDRQETRKLLHVR